MIATIFFIALVTRFVNVYDVSISLISNILVICTIYLILKKSNNKKLKNALITSIIEIPVCLYLLITQKGFISLYGILEISLCYFLFMGLAELSKSVRISRLCIITLILCIIQTIGQTILGSILFISPDISSRGTWIFVFMGVLITILGTIIIGQIVKKLKYINR